MRIILHIGPQKTGTSYMQSVLFRHRRRLAEQGFAYHLPPLRDGLDPRGRPAVRSDLGELIGEGGFQRFEREVAAVRRRGFTCLIISAELLSKVRADQLEPIARLFAEDEVEVYAYIRRWSDRLPSAWWQRVSTGYGVPYPEWLAGMLEKAAGNWVVNESLLWRRFANQFGRKSIRLLSYDAMREAKVDLAEDFMRTRLGYTGLIKPRALERDVHARPSPLEVEIIQQLYRACAAETFTMSMPVKHRLLAELRRANMEPFRTIAGGAVQDIVIDDNGPDFDVARTAMQDWADRLVTADISPHLLLPQARASRIVPRDALEVPAGRAAIADMLAAARALQASQAA